MKAFLKDGSRHAKLLVLLAFALLLAMHQFVAPFADDLWFQNEAETKGLFTFLGSYYNSWSGRLVPNTLAWLLLPRFWLWRLLNPVVILLAAFGMARITTQKVGFGRFALSLALLLCINSRVTGYSIFWATGSLNYLWPITGALFALVPFFDLALRGRPLAAKAVAARLPLVALCCLCSEQVSLCTVAFMVALLLWCLVKHIKVPACYWLAPVVGAAASLPVFLAPGNGKRLLQEAESYYPGFMEMSFGQHAAAGTAWSFEMLFSVLYLLVVALYLVLLWQLGRGGLGRFFWPLFAVGAAAAGTGLFLADSSALFFSFATLVPGLSALQVVLALLPYLFWGLFAACLVLLLVKSGFIYSLSALAALCSILVICFSPTMVASGHRTLMVAGVILCCMLLGRLPQKHQPAAAAVAGSVALVNMANMCLRFWGGMQG